MILDPDNKYIQTINDCVSLNGKTVLEIGCGNGRMTRDLAEFATKVVATDLNVAVLQQARHAVTNDNVDFLFTPSGFPDLPEKSFDLVIYTLSLHHIPIPDMVDNLLHSGRLLNSVGKIVVVEPGDRGSFLEVKKRFGAGSGDESREKAAALKAMNQLPGWDLSPRISFNIDFSFSDIADFYASKLPNHQSLSAKKQLELKSFLRNHTTERGIILTSERYLNVLTRSIVVK